MTENRKTSLKRTAFKHQKLQEITNLLLNDGPMDCKTIGNLIGGITTNAAHRYLEELTKAGYVRKIPSDNRRYNAHIYQFHALYGLKTDLVSQALSHPLHKVTLLLAGISTAT